MEEIINLMSIVLIPKGGNPKFMVDFRPIAFAMWDIRLCFNSG